MDSFGDVPDILLGDFIPLSSGTRDAAIADILPDPNSDSELDPDSQSPWKCSDLHLKGLSLTEKIHEELVRFCECVSPTPGEHAAREDLIDRIRALVTDLFPNATVAVFGSVATRLYLPISDLDVVVLNDSNDTCSCLRKVANEMQKRDFVSFIELILTARIPIVKLTDRVTGISVDICFNVPGGLEACDFFNQYQQEMPALRPLTLFLKYFLQYREMNETFAGGMGSFLLQMMIISHLQLHPFATLKTLSKKLHRDLNLGALLLSFFELYGKTLNYAVVGISVRDKGSYYIKSQRGFVDPSRPYLLSVENPLDPTFDIGRNSYGVMRIRRAFGWAYTQLTKDTPEDNSGATLLGRLVSVQGGSFRTPNSSAPTQRPRRRNLPHCSPQTSVSNTPGKKLKEKAKNMNKQTGQQGRGSEHQNKLGKRQAEENSKATEKNPNTTKKRAHNTVSKTPAKKQKKKPKSMNKQTEKQGLNKQAEQQSPGSEHQNKNGKRQAEKNSKASTTKKRAQNSVRNTPAKKQKKKPKSMNKQTKQRGLNKQSEPNGPSNTQAEKNPKAIEKKPNNTKRRKIPN